MIFPPGLEPVTFDKVTRAKIMFIYVWAELGVLGTQLVSWGSLQYSANIHFNQLQLCASKQSLFLSLNKLYISVVFWCIGERKHMSGHMAGMLQSYDAIGLHVIILAIRISSTP